MVAPREPESIALTQKGFRKRYFPDATVCVCVITLSPGSNSPFQRRKWRCGQGSNRREPLYKIIYCSKQNRHVLERFRGSFSYYSPSLSDNLIFKPARILHTVTLQLDRSMCVGSAIKLCPKSKPIRLVVCGPKYSMWCADICCAMISPRYCFDYRTRGE